MKAGAEPARQLLDGADPFAGGDCITDPVNTAVWGAEVCIAAKYSKMKKAGASVYADAPVVDQFVDELTINPASWVIYHLFDLKLVFWHDSLLFIMYYVLKVGQ